MIYRALFICLLVAAAPLRAADLDAALARCGAVEDDAQRLACYDRLAKGADSDASAAAPALETATIAPPPEEAKPRRQPRAVEEAEEESERSVWRRWFKRDRKSAAEEAVAEDASRNRAAADGQGEAIAGEIVRLRKLTHGNFQITLDNGQVWRENEYEPNTTYAVGDQVTVEVDFMGTRVLRNKRTRQSARVRRVR